MRDGRELELGYIVQLRLELRVAFAGPAYLGGLAVSYVDSCGLLMIKFNPLAVVFGLDAVGMMHGVLKVGTTSCLLLVHSLELILQCLLIEKFALHIVFVDRLFATISKFTIFTLLRRRHLLVEVYKVLPVDADAQPGPELKLILPLALPLLALEMLINDLAFKYHIGIELRARFDVLVDLLQLFHAIQGVQIAFNAHDGLLGGEGVLLVQLVEDLVVLGFEVGVSLPLAALLCGLARVAVSLGVGCMLDFLDQVVCYLIYIGAELVPQEL